jgi:hypothetical protein
MHHQLGQETSRTLVGLTLIATVLGCLAAPASAQFCSDATTCRSLGHSTLSSSTYPYTEDIGGDITLTGPTSSWTVLQTYCPQLTGSLNGSAAFNALLRAQLSLSSGTAAAGSRYEVQLLVDGVEHGWYVRRFRGEFPQVDIFGGSVQNLAAGAHTFQVQARVLDSGTMRFTTTYITAQGTPATYPGAKSVLLDSTTIQTSGYIPVTDTVQFSNTVAVDIAIDGYVQINAGTAGQQVEIVPFLDGLPAGNNSFFGIPPNLYDGVNVLTVLTGVPAGNHSLNLAVNTYGYSTQFSAREIEFTAFPATTYYAFANSGSLTTVDSNTTQAQPTYLDTVCGLWSKLLEATIQRDNSNGRWYNQVYEGYIHFPGGASDYTPPVTWAALSFETFFGDGGTDGGSRSVSIPLSNGGSGSPYADGFYIFGDTAAFAEPWSIETVLLWARKVNSSCSPQNNGQQGAFNLTDRFFWVRHTPFGGGCIYQ